MLDGSVTSGVDERESSDRAFKSGESVRRDVPLCEPRFRFELVLLNADGRDPPSCRFNKPARDNPKSVNFRCPL